MEHTKKAPEDYHETLDDLSPLLVMHELPKDLTNSLRSFRGSIYGNSRKSGHNGNTEAVDLEKGSQDDGAKELGRTLNTTESSLILVDLQTSPRQKTSI